MNNDYAKFGNLVSDYEVARLEYPEEAIRYCLEQIGTRDDRRILDLGCGTGISTRQLAGEGRLIIGGDPDQEMLLAAMQHSANNISYIKTTAENLPFESEFFDGVTAFGSFHWFTGDDAMDEIKRVLKPGGTFIAINKKEVGSFREERRAIQAKYVDGELPDVKKDYQPEEILTKNGLSEVGKKIFESTENFTLDELIQLIKSFGLWNKVPESRRNDAEDEFREYFELQLSDGVYARTIDVEVVFGRNAAV